MTKKYIIFDLDGTLIESNNKTVDLILDFIKNYEGFDKENALYVIKTSFGTPLRKLLEIIFPKYSSEKINTITNDIYSKLETHESDFFEGVIEKIEDLSKKYKLFLTTGNSTKTAKKHLDKGGISKHFELIYGSDKILKGTEHLEIFQEYSVDEDFYKKSIYIGDGDSDRIFANSKNIDFVHIGNNKQDRYEIESVKQIDDILKLFEK